MSNTLEDINQTSNTNFLFIKDNVPASIKIEPFVQEELEAYRPGITTVLTISNQDGVFWKLWLNVTQTAHLAEALLTTLPVKRGP